MLSCASFFSGVQLCETPRTVARQAPVSMEFSRQEYWSGLLCPPPGDLPNPGINTGVGSHALFLEIFPIQGSNRSPALQADMATHSSTLAWKIPWTEEPGRYSPWGCEESDMTEQLHFTSSLYRLSHQGRPRSHEEMSKWGFEFSSTALWTLPIKTATRGHTPPIPNYFSN